MKCQSAASLAPGFSFHSSFTMKDLASCNSRRAQNYEFLHLDQFSNGWQHFRELKGPHPHQNRVADWSGFNWFNFQCTFRGRAFCK